uniref:Surfactant protein C n=1 Tax=Crocodylus porosus TaxID=8502 RepID=A0A7M4E3Y8_CROPO
MGCGAGCPSCTTCCSACPGREGCCQLGCGCCLRYLCCLPRLLCSLPKLIGHSLHLKRILIIVVIIVVVVLVIVGALLLGLHITQERSEAVSHGGGTQSPGACSTQGQLLSCANATSHPGSLVHIQSGTCMKLLIGYRSWLGQACYVTRMDKDNIQGVDAITKAFQYHQVSTRLDSCSLGQAGHGGAMALMPSAIQADRSTLGTTINILCSHLPIYWA